MATKQTSTSKTSKKDLEKKKKAEDKAKAGATGGESCGDFGEGGCAGEAVDKGRAIEKHA